MRFEECERAMIMMFGFGLITGLCVGMVLTLVFTGYTA